MKTAPQQSQKPEKTADIIARTPLVLETIIFEGKPEEKWRFYC